MKNNKPNQNDEDREFQKMLRKRFLRFLTLAEIIVIILAAGTVATLVYDWLLPNVDKNIAVAASGAFAGATGAFIALAACAVFVWPTLVAEDTAGFDAAAGAVTTLTGMALFFASRK